jgi:thioredoxin-like negative regulator of GroEL
MIELLLQAERAMSVGMIEQAERLYRQAFQADPRNSIAVVGLARVALERGDEVRAYQLARQALTIDPENAAADRMARRLAEVMSHRGDPVPADPVIEAAEPSATPEPAAAPPDRTGSAGESPGERHDAPAGRPGLLRRLLRRR